MTPEEKAEFWAKVYVSALRGFEVGANLGGQGTSIKQATEYATGCADKALEALNQRLNGGAFSN